VKQIVLAALYGLGGSLLGFLALGVALVIFKPFYGPLIFLVFEMAWIGYALFRMVRGLRNFRKPSVAIRAKADLAFSLCVLGTIGISSLWFYYFPPQP